MPFERKRRKKTIKGGKGCSLLHVPNSSDEKEKGGSPPSSPTRKREKRKEEKKGRDVPVLE